MKVLLVDVNYGNGSTGKIISSIHSQLEKKGDQAYIAFGRGDRTDSPNVKRVSGKAEVYFHNQRFSPD